MLIVCCNVCRKNLPSIAVDAPVAHLCERCAPHGEKWNLGVQRLAEEHSSEWLRKVNKFRDQFLQEVVLARKAELKAV